MRVAFVVDGRAEFASLGELFGQLESSCGHSFQRALKADIQPLAPIPVIARQCLNPARQQLLRGADRVLVLIDREQREECPGAFATAVRRRLVDALRSDCVDVVVKNRMYENWLISDIRALQAQPARFQVSQRTQRAVEPNKADSVNALELIKRSVQGEYDKVRDAQRILKHAVPADMAAHSRSFRRFMRCVGDGAYRDQSARPAGP